jgi:hypothetical protein
MNVLSARANSRPPVPTSRNRAWREEMLDQLLENMRERRLPDETPSAQAANRAASGKGKGLYVDLYV